MKRHLIGVFVLWPAAALGQAPAGLWESPFDFGPMVFFDDFEGNALLPHWGQPPPSHWEYNVSNSMLNVTGLFNPSNPKTPGNIAAMGALFASQGDFRMDVWMGWETGGAPHRLAVQVRAGPTASVILANFGYAHDEKTFGPVPVIFAQTNQPPVTQPAPMAGLHHFTIARTSNQFEFYLDGALFFSAPGSTPPITGVVFDFLGPYPGQLGPFHIDRVLVVPAPSALMVAPAMVLACVGRRKRRPVSAG